MMTSVGKIQIIVGKHNIFKDRGKCMQGHGNASININFGTSFAAYQTPQHSRLDSDL